METPPPSATAAQIIEVLRQLGGMPILVALDDRRILTVHNIAWGQDFADPEYHVTTNISPVPNVPHVVDVFSTAAVVRITDPISGDVHFDKSSPSNNALERTREE
ncbi:glr2693 [Gloeobacter violaceus PCC 7421]|uniref:Glr2693 protein n=1 Tax=Gloeobacter violaceus (strain ATCC 29082 / PCC 7421) TaxID=251221 RepID=Q7NH44_GLOVI|nr:glr2693 [Gloeobacter violaceus PCC 7421]